MRSELFGRNLEASTPGEAFALQNSRMLRVALDGEVMARQGSMIAFQGQVDFEYQGSGGIGRMLKKAVTGEGVPLMRCRGKGEVFFANYAAEVHLLRLEGDVLSVNGRSILAFEPTLSWDIRRIEGASMFAGGLFNTVLEGTGKVGALVGRGSGEAVQLAFAGAGFVIVQASEGEGVAPHNHGGGGGGGGLLDFG
ncbi:MAG TPA: AIM24 family protein [Actinomycetota bacterium]